MILGVLALLAPLVAGIAIAVLVGVLLIVGGVAECVLGLRTRHGKQAVFTILLGALGIVTGIVMVAFPALALVSLTLLVAAYFLAHGVLQIAWAFRLRPADGWVWSLVSGIASLVLAVVIGVQWPFSGLWTIGLLAGVKMLFTGATLIALGQANRGAPGQARQRMRPAA
jgi:uncharacterized membrane protein HdeD (DUF308 family)